MLEMFKPTQPLFRRLQRLALTTKQVNGGYYKGTGTGSMGRHTKYGGYVVEWSKVRTYVVPADMKGFMVSFPMRESSGKKGGKNLSKGERETCIYADSRAPSALTLRYQESRSSKGKVRQRSSRCLERAEIL